jgi:hypothetical protein
MRALKRHARPSIRSFPSSSVLTWNLCMGYSNSFPGLTLRIWQVG